MSERIPHPFGYDACGRPKTKHRITQRSFIEQLRLSDAIDRCPQKSVRRLAIADGAKADAENQHDHVDQNAEQAKPNGDETEHLGFLRRVLGPGDITGRYFAIYLSRENNGRDRERPATEYRDNRRH